MMLTKPLFLIGLRASGKTSLGKRLASRLSLPFYDTDEVVQSKYKMDIASMVTTYGWQFFRKEESEILKSIPLSSCIVSTGGGVILSAENRNYMKLNGFCVYLNPPIDSLVLRLMYNPLQSQRPSLTNVSNNDTSSLHKNNESNESIGEEVKRTFLERDALYKEVANIILDTSKDIQSLVELLVQKV